MDGILNMYKIKAVSIDGQGYEVELACKEGKVTECFQTYMANIGWTQYQYKITSFSEVETSHIEIDYNDTDNR